LYNSGGNYTVKVIAETALGCKDSAFKQITVFSVPVSNFSYTPVDTCTGPVTVNFTNLSQNALGYLWSFGNGNTSTNINTVTTYSGIGDYPIQLISSNQYSCYDTSNSIYHVYQMPKANLDFSPDKGCPPLNITFTNNSQFGKSYLWHFGDGDTSTAFSPTHIYPNTGLYQVRLIVSAGQFCLDSITATQRVQVFSKPIPVFKPKIIPDRKPYRSVTFDINIDSIGSFEWHFDDGGISREPIPVHRFGDADSGWRKITLKVASIDGCDTSYIDSIFLPPYWNGLYIPNAFTPSLGTGGANEFKPIGIELAIYEVKVFNKWGELMWESTKLNAAGEPEEAWNGTDKNGIQCMQGSYIWTVEAIFTDGKPWSGMLLNDGNVHKKGNVTLIR
jgi:PKD repeat protein